MCYDIRMNEPTKEEKHSTEPKTLEQEWKELVDAKLKEAEGKQFPPRFAITMRGSDSGYFITIAKREPYTVVFFHANLDFAKPGMHSAVVLEEKQKARELLQVPENGEWHLTTDGRDTKLSFKFLKGAKIFNPHTGGLWKGKYPDVEGVIKGLRQ